MKYFLLSFIGTLVTLLLVCLIVFLAVEGYTIGHCSALRGGTEYTHLFVPLCKAG